MGFRVTNMSNNPLPVGGRMLASGESRKVNNLSEQEMDFRERRWLTAIEEEGAKTETLPPAQPPIEKPQTEPTAEIKDYADDPKKKGGRR